MTPSPATTPSIHEAMRATDGSGGVQVGPPLTRDEAIARRQSGSDVVICGDDTFANAREAHTIESAVGACIPDGPHVNVAGRLALPHFQQSVAPPEGHTFYETPIRKVIPAP